MFGSKYFEWSPRAPSPSSAARVVDSARKRWAPKSSSAGSRPRPAPPSSPRCDGRRGRRGAPPGRGCWRRPRRARARMPRSRAWCGVPAQAGTAHDHDVVGLQVVVVRGVPDGRGAVAVADHGEVGAPRARRPVRGPQPVDGPGQPRTAAGGQVLGRPPRRRPSHRAAAGCPGRRSRSRASRRSCAAGRAPGRRRRGPTARATRSTALEASVPNPGTRTETSSARPRSPAASASAPSPPNASGPVGVELAGQRLPRGRVPLGGR